MTRCGAPQSAWPASIHMFSRPDRRKQDTRRCLLRTAVRASQRPAIDGAGIREQGSILFFRTAGPGRAVVATIRAGRVGLAMPKDAAMTSKWIALLFSAIALAGCCASGTGCYAPVAGTPVAWDGLGPPPDDQPRVVTAAGVIEEQPRRPAKPAIRPNGGGTAASAIKPHSDEWWAQKEAEDRNAEKALARKLIICRGCSSSSTKEDGPTGSVPR
jgi:hypothetical protein